jgi:iron(III) transport system ATP-binding protein
MTHIVTEGLSRTLGSTRAVDEVSLDIADGELFFLLGPSGCGKSTLLGLIAGLDQPDRGRISFDNRDVTRVATEQRNAVMCFQSYALFPHLDVAANVGFGLEVRRVPLSARQRRVEEVLELVRMAEFKSRKPAELSGGQQQRVALARALAVDPACLLLDEPLSNLDARLRHEMRNEIRRVCKASKHTTIYVTHDQKEALSVADRIAVMNHGRVVQVGTPTELYRAPASAFVAEFIAGANLLAGTVVGHDGQHAKIATPLGVLVAAARGELPKEVTLSVRPDQLQLHTGSEPPGPNMLHAQVLESGFLGESSEHTLGIAQTQLRAIHTPPLFELARELAISIAPADLIIHPRQ